MNIIDRAAYKAPDRENYQIKTKRTEKTRDNFQPMTRSTYGRDFLNYGSLPSFKFGPKNNQIFPSFTHQKKITCYETDFTPKKTQNMDFK